MQRRSLNTAARWASVIGKSECSRARAWRAGCHLVQSRAGFTLLEMFVAVFVLGVVLSTFLPLMQSLGHQQRMTDQRLLALREAENVLEQLSQRNWNELTAEELKKISLADDVKARLPQVQLLVDVEKPNNEPPSKRIAVQVNWTPRPSQAPQSVRLAAWFYQSERQP